MTARIYVIYGQGDAFTSRGMVQLAARIRSQWPKAKVTEHVWRTGIAVIVPDIKAQALDERIILIGYSLGANDVTMIANRVGHRSIDLAVCYDPSVMGQVEQPGANVKRLLLYHNSGNPDVVGHAIFQGAMVERTEISEAHLSVDNDEKLHQQTMAAIAHVMGAG